MKLNLMLAGAAVSLASTAAFGLKLPSGSQTAAEAQRKPFNGELLATLDQPYLTAHFSGRLVSNVYAGDITNPLGGLTFTYQIFTADTYGYRTPVISLNIHGFVARSIDVSYAHDSGDIMPTHFTRDASGGVVGEQFRGWNLEEASLLSGRSSGMLVIRTDSPTHSIRTALLANGAISSVFAIAPASRIVPEPTSALAIILPSASRRRRHC